MKISDGCLLEAQQIPTENRDDRLGTEISLIVLHNISLPAGSFGTPYIRELFCNVLDCTVHPDFQSLIGLRVSSHLLIRRHGEISQFVAFPQRAWHAGESSFQGRDNCNDFSIGIELEGTDDIPYTDAQYLWLGEVCQLLMDTYNIKDIVGHADIAPGRKTDPGESFDWSRFRELIAGGSPRTCG